MVGRRMGTNPTKWYYEDICAKALVKCNLGQWTLERSSCGYYLKRPASGTYVAAQRVVPRGHALYLTTELIGMEFVLDGNADDGYV
jgi:hypothetical protein